MFSLKALTKGTFFSICQNQLKCRFPGQSEVQNWKFVVFARSYSAVATTPSSSKKTHKGREGHGNKRSSSKKAKVMTDPFQGPDDFKRDAQVLFIQSELDKMSELLTKEPTKETKNIQAEKVGEAEETEKRKDVKEVTEGVIEEEDSLGFKKLDPAMLTFKKSLPSQWKTSKDTWKTQEYALRSKFDKWRPLKKVSRETMESIRSLKESVPYITNTEIGDHFKISPEAVRRILKSRWTPSEKEEQKILERWKRRKEVIKWVKYKNQSAEEMITVKDRIGFDGLQNVVMKPGYKYDASSQEGRKFNRKAKINKKSTSKTARARQSIDELF